MSKGFWRKCQYNAFVNMQSSRSVVASDHKDEREGLLTTIRARRKWYLVLYFLLIGSCLIIGMMTDFKPADSLSRHILDAIVTMNSVAVGALVATIFLIDVVFDGGRYLIGKGGEIMGLLFSPVKNRFVAQGVAQGIAEGVAQGLAQGVAEGIAQGEKKADARLEAWLASNPEIQKLIDEGKAKAPPTLNGKNDRR